jgi:hypothetical protein
MGQVIDAPRRDTASHTGTGVLHNMSARPRTTVTTKVPPLRGRWVSFTLGHVPALDDADCRRLDAVWQRCGLSGAALVHPLSTEIVEAVELVTSTDDDLNVNVVLRTRGSLLLAGMPLIEYADGLVGHTLVSDDPRLLAIVDRQEVHPS